MNTLWSAYLYFGGFILSAVVSTGFALYAWRHRQVASATSFAWLLTFGSLTQWGGLGTTLFPPETGIPYIVMYANMIGVMLMPPAWLCFALDYSGRAEWLTRRRVLAIYALPLISLGLLYTNPLHHYFLREIQFIRVGYITAYHWVYGPWFPVYLAANYGFWLLGTALLIRFALRAFKEYRSQALLLVLGACAPLIPTTLVTLHFTQVSYTFVGFMVTAVLYGQAVFRYRLLNLSPVARHTLVDMMSDSMLVVDVQEKIVDCNPALMHLLGLTPTAGLIGRPVWDFLPPGAAWETWLRAPEGAQATVTLPGPRAYDLRVTLLYDRWRRVSGRLAVLRDITERQQAAEALARYAHELEARNAELDAFAHTVAHDLKNPLSAVVGYGLFLVSRYGKMNDEQRLEMLNTINKQGQRMTRIIDELLLFASLRKLGEVAFSPLDMAQIVAEVQERLAAAIEEKQAHLTLPERWPVAVGYAAWVEEIWANYLSNALKYGGTPPQIVLGWEAQGAWLRFWVQDNGAGLTPEEQSRLFTPFTRLDQVSAKGHGLGLSIVRRISEKLGGAVGVESAPGAGSKFYFTLPAVPGPSE